MVAMIDPTSSIDSFGRALSNLIDIDTSIQYASIYVCESEFDKDEDYQ